jgi:hypothetical protein
MVLPVSIYTVFSRCSLLTSTYLSHPCLTELLGRASRQWRQRETKFPGQTWTGVIYIKNSKCITFTYPYSRSLRWREVRGTCWQFLAAKRFFTVDMTLHSDIKQDVLDRPNLPTFLTLFNNAVWMTAENVPLMGDLNKDKTLYKITEFYTEWFSVYPNITSKFRTIAIFKSLFKEDNE